jgi:hypothetical protein
MYDALDIARASRPPMARPLVRRAKPRAHRPFSRRPFCREAFDDWVATRRRVDTPRG